MARFFYTTISVLIFSLTLSPLQGKCRRPPTQADYVIVGLGTTKVIAIDYK